MSAGGLTTIVGAGIVGAVTAFELARAGLRVRVLEAGPAPAGGVSGRSFGWVNTLADDAGGDPRRFGLRLAAMERFDALDALLPEGLPGGRIGGLVWKPDIATTETFARKQAAAGARVTLCDRARVRALAPLLARPPACAVHAADEWALDVPALCRRLLASARAAGAEIGTGIRVRSVEAGPQGGATLTIDGDVLTSDHVVLAAGAATLDLLPGIDLSRDLEISAATLIRLQVDRAPGGPVCQAPSLEWRQAGDNTVLVADGPPESEDEAALARIAARNRETLRELMPAAGRVKVSEVLVGARPMPVAGRPLVGPLAAAPAILPAIAHPGVILAPAIAETLKGVITGRPVDSGLSADPIAP